MSTPEHAFPRLVIAGTSSGVGKTTVTVALARALRARGLRVALFKCGPDYLDPTYHARAIDAPSQNLDGWMMGHDAVRTTFAHAARDADISLIEGVMGLFDGASPTGEEGSTAEIAKWLDAPVVLVVDAGGMARSIAALVGGFASFDPNLNVAAAIANRIGSRGHLDLLRRALHSPPILGGLPRDAEHAFAERHLGLHTADETALPTALLDHWGEQATSWLSIEALLTLATSAPHLAPATSLSNPSPATRAPNLSLATSSPNPEPATRAPSPPGGGPGWGSRGRCRIALARDPAFHFYYADNLRRLESLGAELVPFSPTHDTALPDVDGIYLGGGYPELHAATLSANTAMRESITAFAQAGGPIYAECGGLMYLTQAIVTVDGQRHPMVGLIPSEARMCTKLQALGYVEIETQTKTILGGAGSRFRGHQFRYSELSPEPPDSIERIYSVRRRRAGDTIREGYRIGNLIASYVHAHWASNPRIAASFVESCAAYRAGSARTS